MDEQQLRTGDFARPLTLNQCHRCAGAIHGALCMVAGAVFHFGCLNDEQQQQVVGQGTHFGSPRLCSAVAQPALCQQLAANSVRCVATERRKWRGLLPSPACTSVVLAYKATAIVQKLNLADMQALGAMLLEFSGRWVEMALCPHLSIVHKKILEVLPAESMASVIREFVGQAVRVACDEHGFRAVSRFVGRHPRLPECRALVGELAGQVDGVVSSKYGRGAVLWVISKCYPDQPECCALVEKLLGKLKDDVCERSVLMCLEACCMEHGGDSVKHRIVRCLSESFENLLRVAQEAVLTLASAVLRHCSADLVRELCGSVTRYIIDVTATQLGCQLYLSFCLDWRSRQEAEAMLTWHSHSSQLMHLRPYSRALMVQVLGEEAVSDALQNMPVLVLRAYVDSGSSLSASAPVHSSTLFSWHVCDMHLVTLGGVDRCQVPVASEAPLTAVYEQLVNEHCAGRLGVGLGLGRIDAVLPGGRLLSQASSEETVRSAFGHGPP